MPDQGYPEAVLLMTTAQWRFWTDRINAGNASLEQMFQAISQRLTGTWAEGIDPDFRTWGPNPDVQKYSSVGGSFDLAHGYTGVNQWLTATWDQSEPPVFGESQNWVPGGPGLAAPLPTTPITFPSTIFDPTTTGGTMVLNPGIAGGLLRIIQQVMKAVGATVGKAGGWRAALGTIMGGLGVTQVIDIIDQWIPGLGDADKEKMATVLEAFAQLEDAGLIHPWTPRARRDGTEAPGPFYLVFDLVQVQGHYTNFHMSRKGLSAHDDKQDTYKRPRRTRRSNRKP